MPDYEDRVASVREAGIGAGTFLTEVLLPVLRRVGLKRADVFGALKER